MADILTDMSDRDWTLAQLVETATELLHAARIRVADERVSLVPDARTVRYYQSLGILARPVRYEGRSAIYGYRSLLQLVAVKLLQAQGHSLSQVQASIAIASVAELEKSVRSCLPSGSVGAIPVPEPTAPSRWTTVEVVPGVLISIDASRVPEPRHLMAEISTLLCQKGSSS